MKQPILLLGIRSVLIALNVITKFRYLLLKNKLNIKKLDNRKIDTVQTEQLIISFLTKKLLQRPTHQFTQS